MTNLITPSKIRFIKLGAGGKWEKESIESENPVIRLGYESNQHQASLDGNWDEVRKSWYNGSDSAASNHLRQIKAFYTADENTLWFTFYLRKLYWCFVEKEVIELEDGSRIRKVKGAWSDKDLTGNELSVDKLNGCLISTQGYQGTICGLDEEMTNYLTRKINGEELAEVKTATEALKALSESLLVLIKSLHYRDFELLVDLTFSRLGWQRYSVLGKTEKDIDLDIYLPAANKRAFVQIKSSTNKKDILKYIEKYQHYENYKEFYFIYHTCNDDVSDIANDEIHLIDGLRMAKLVIQAGLIDWLLNKCA